MHIHYILPIKFDDVIDTFKLEEFLVMYHSCHLLKLFIFQLSWNNQAVDSFHLSCTTHQMHYLGIKVRTLITSGCSSGCGTFLRVTQEPMKQISDDIGVEDEVQKLVTVQQ